MREVEDILEKLEDHEKRISKIERLISSKKAPKKLGDYKGLSGGIRLLIDNGFFNELKSIKETQDELKKEGYHYPIASIAKMLSIDFMKNQKILTRIKEERVWKYVIRK